MSKSCKIHLVMLITFSFNFVQGLISLTSMSLGFNPWLHKATKFLWSHCLLGTIKKCEPVSQGEFGNNEKDSTELWRMEEWPFRVTKPLLRSASWKAKFSYVRIPFCIKDTSWLTTQPACWLVSQENICIFMVLYNHSMCCVLSSCCGKPG